MLIAIIESLSLVLVTFMFHYRVLLWLSNAIPKTRINTQLQVLTIVMILFVAHLIEIGIYAAAYLWSSFLGLGEFTGAISTSPMSYLYYSGVIFTTLGLGDIQPVGHLRFITAAEALNGFLLITWSASFTFIAMMRLWQWDIKR